MAFISFAQNGEDVLLHRVFGDVEDGFFIDAGAAHPVSHSVTKAFSLRGWRGVNVEPLDQFFRPLREDRPREVNLQIGLSDRAGFATFYEVPSCTGWSTFDTETVERIRTEGKPIIEHTVQVLTLANVCDHYAPATIHFLKVDVEGHERAVLSGADFNRWRPLVVLVEATVQGTTKPNHHSWEPILTGSGYQFAHFDGLNRYYVRDEDATAILPKLSYPVCAFDDFVRFEQVEALEKLRADAAADRNESEQFRAEIDRLRAEAGLLVFDRDQTARQVAVLRAKWEQTTEALADSVANAARMQSRWEAAAASLSKTQAQIRVYREMLSSTRDQLEAAQASLFRHYIEPAMRS